MNQVVTGGLGVRPLLELHQHIRRLARLRVHTAQEGVDALRGVRQLVLQQHFNVPETSLLEVGQKWRKAQLPRTQLTVACAGIELDTGLLGEQFVQLLCLGLHQQ